MSFNDHSQIGECHFIVFIIALSSVMRIMPISRDQNFTNLRSTQVSFLVCIADAVFYDFPIRSHGLLKFIREIVIMIFVVVNNRYDWLITVSL